tara:strand:+ start:258 stop:944 length:687 start_codon:yes stop_codon:yes gene_type:complete
MQTSPPLNSISTAKNATNKKIFIIGLPRTGTTSISVAMLALGFKVAHTAFTKQTFELADVISDAPCFSDYQQLDKLFPDSMFVYLQRDLLQWVPSMQRLLVKMAPHLLTKTGHFSPVLKRAFNISFGEDHQLRCSEQHLTECYLRHQNQVQQYFKGRTNLLSINLSHEKSYVELCTFLSLPYEDGTKFPHLNQGAQVANWKACKHTNKVSSFSAGKDHRQFFDYIKND